MPVLVTVKDLKRELATFNRRYPRPGMEKLKLSKPYDLHAEFDWHCPNHDKPGVYAISHRDGHLLYIGKASCRNTLGARLRAYFGWGRWLTRAVAVHPSFRRATTVYTVGLPRERAFEAPALDEYLLSRLTPSINTIGV